MNTTTLTNLSNQKWVENFSRFGIISKGIVYCILGLLAFMAAIGSGQNKPSKEGAFHLILAQPFGKILLAIVAIGLLGYVVWRFIQAIKDTEHKGQDVKGMTKRIGFALSGLVYAAIACAAGNLALGNGNNSEGGKKQLVQQLLNISYGEIILAIIGLIIIGQAVNQIYKAYTGKFKDKIHQENMKSAERTVFEKVGIVGYLSRGVVLGIIGYFVLRAAIESNSSNVKDTDGAFSFINSSFGPIVFGIVALGLIAYGIFMFFMSKYREI